MNIVILNQKKNKKVKKNISNFIGHKIRGTRVVPITLKITGLFTVLLLLSNFTTNYINLVLNRGVQIKLLNQLLVRDLKDLHIFSNNQFEIFSFNEDKEESVKNIRERAIKELRGEKSVFIGINKDSSLFFSVSPSINIEEAERPSLNSLIKEAADAGTIEGAINFYLDDLEYFGVFKLNQKWDTYLVRAEEVNEFYSPTRVVFNRVAVIIIAITIGCGILGIFLVNSLLRFVKLMTDQIMAMRTDQAIGIIDLKDAPNDDITLLGMSFNSLSSNIDNLMNIFKKFVTADVARKAYREQKIKLEGSSKELTILFSDIKQFTNMTEILGTDIINLINMHYQEAIKKVHRKEGIVGSIIGDALLAVFGTFDDSTENKSVQALAAGYGIQEVAASLRKKMIDKKEEIVKKYGSLSAAEELVYRAVLIEVGVGIDGGDVFYGNIGSNERMTNTVIGDNVNSSSRLEGLTRIYKVPLICSEYIKNDAIRHNADYFFQELDTVKVKGKKVGKKVFWPVPLDVLDSDLEGRLEMFDTALKAYYKGEWKDAEKYFSKCGIPAAEVFISRISGAKPPENWNGIWTMMEK